MLKSNLTLRQHKHCILHKRVHKGPNNKAVLAYIQMKEFTSACINLETLFNSQLNPVYTTIVIYTNEKFFLLSFSYMNVAYVCVLFTYTYNVVHDTLGWVTLTLVLVSISKFQL